MTHISRIDWGSSSTQKFIFAQVIFMFDYQMEIFVLIIFSSIFIPLVPFPTCMRVHTWAITARYLKEIFLPSHEKADGRKIYSFTKNMTPEKTV